MNDDCWHIGVQVPNVDNRRRLTRTIQPWILRQTRLKCLSVDVVKRDKAVIDAYLGVAHW